MAKARKKKAPDGLTEIERFQRKMRQMHQGRRDAHDARVRRQAALPMGHKENVHKIAMTFGPLEAWLDTVERTGELDAMQDGTAIFQPDPQSDEYYPVGPALEGVCETYEMIATDLGIPDESAGLARVASKVNVGMMLFESDLAAARASIAWMRKVAADLTPNQFSDYAVAVQIRTELAAQQPQREAA